MAFDRPLDADKVEDNILISLVRGSIIGTLMWILGDDNDAERRLASGLQDMILDDDCSHSNCSNGLHDETRMDEPTSLPRMVQSDVSVAGMNNDTSNPQETTLPRNLGAASLYAAMTRSNNDSKSSIPRMEKKKMSWSDNLVEYMDDESTRHEPPSPVPGRSSHGAAKPIIKSSMTRSASQHLSADRAGEEERKIRYLPHGLDRAHNGLIMPTPRPNGNHANGDGSPNSFGWFVGLTPPTPEYWPRSSLKSSQKSHDTSSTALSTTSSNGNAFDHTTAAQGPNRVFQGLKAGSNRPPVGWPSVPL